MGTSEQDLIEGKTVWQALFQHADAAIAVSLRFQAVGFLADYAAMQQAPTILSVESVELPADIQPHTQTQQVEQSVEVGGRDGPDPTRFGDWEKAGRCIDF